jgi:hypothetical protein
LMGSCSSRFLFLISLIFQIRKKEWAQGDLNSRPPGFGKGFQFRNPHISRALQPG